MKYKVGNEVEIINNKENPSGKPIGYRFIINEVHEGCQTWYREVKGVSDGVAGCSLKLAKGRLKPKAITHLVVWDVKGCGDPVEAFTDLLDAKDKAKELLKDNNIVEESVTIYEVKSIMKPKLTISFRRKR